MRGEHIIPTEIIAVHNGSSPLARGTPDLTLTQIADQRIIPACAGNTWSKCRCWWCFWDHPRLRGEHCSVGSHHSPSRGSSPLARGTRFPESASSPGVGIIPACAGNTLVVPPASGQNTDHPRLRGEHCGRVMPDCPASGSSPLARGTPSTPSWSDRQPRIIPACAGNTSERLGESTPFRDHPRLRGEHSDYGCETGEGHGSSPLARGTPPTRRRSFTHHRIIPACAGNTAGKDSIAAWLADHPRLRGEHVGHR